MTVTVGERVPNFLRHNAAGEPVNFYQDCCAKRVVLISSLQSTIEPSLAKNLLGADGDWQVVVLLRGDPEKIVQSAGRLPGAVAALADDGAVIDFLAGANPQPFALVLDRNFRLLARQSLTCKAADIAGVYARAERVTTAPVLIVPRVLDVALCRQLIELCDSASEPSGVMRMEAGKMVYAKDPRVKIRREHRLQPGPLWDVLEQRMQRCLLPEIKWVFNYEVTRFEGVKVVRYAADSGGFFSAHRDNDGADTAHRRFALTINLNAEDYAGGDLCFPEYGDAGYRPGTGGAAVFSCNLAHEARPVTQGVRYALVSFFFSATDGFVQADYENRVQES